MLSYFTNYGTSLHISNNSANQWIDATTLHIIFAGIILIMSVFALESPRWLAKVGRNEQAGINMSKLRNLPQDHPYVGAELIDIHDQLEREREATLGASFLAVSFFSLPKSLRNTDMKQNGVELNQSRFMHPNSLLSSGPLDKRRSSSQPPFSVS
jgi:hypothetical protein